MHQKSILIGAFLRKSPTCCAYVFSLEVTPSGKNYIRAHVFQVGNTKISKTHIKLIKIYKQIFFYIKWFHSDRQKSITFHLPVNFEISFFIKQAQQLFWNNSLKIYENFDKYPYGVFSLFLSHYKHILLKIWKSYGSFIFLSHHNHAFF